MNIIKYLSIASLCLVLLIALYGPSKFLEQFWGNPDMGYIEIKTLAPTNKPNTALACPLNYCTQRKPDIITSNYSVSSEILRDKIIDYFNNDTNAKYISAPEDKLSLRFITYSPTLRFPDTIQVQLIKSSQSTSTLAIFARAKIGHSDFGANKARVKEILAALKPFEKH